MIFFWSWLCFVPMCFSLNASEEAGQTTSDNVSAVVEKFKKNWPVEQWKRLGFFQEDIILEINVHWLSFRPPPTSSFYTVAVVYIFIAVLGFIGNFLVTLLFIRYGRHGIVA